jgi:hypothetical protein
MMLGEQGTRILRGGVYVLETPGTQGSRLSPTNRDLQLGVAMASRVRGALSSSGEAQLR